MRRFLMSATAVVCLQGVGQAEDVGAVGQLAKLRVERSEGDRFDVTVTPPPDKAVDKRILAWLADLDPEARTLSDDEPIDLSDYRVRIDYAGSSKATGAASCRATIKLKAKPINLGPDKSWIFESFSAMNMSIAAFPTKGDVAMAIFNGPDLDTCVFSNKGKATLDAVSCTLDDCQNNSPNDSLHGIVGNVTTSQATYVGVHHLVYATLP